MEVLDRKTMNQELKYSMNTTEWSPKFVDGNSKKKIP